MNLCKKENLFTPIKEIWQELEYKNLDVINLLNLKLNENKLLNNYDEALNNGIFHSINYYENIKILNIFELSKKEAYLYYTKFLKNDFSLYGIKSFKFKKNILIKIFYQLLYFREKFDNYVNFYDYLINNIKFIDFTDNEDKLYDVNVLILIDKNNKKIILEENELKKYIYFPKNKKEKLVSSSIFFNESSLKIIEKQDLNSFVKFSNKNFCELIDLIHNNFDFLNKQKIMIFSSMVLEILGLRKANDIDMYIHSLDELNLNKTKVFDELKYLDFKIKNTDNWPSHWNKWLDNWANKCEAKYFEEILGNQRFHFYFLGIKIINLNCDIMRRIIRERPASFCDLIMINKKLNLNITLPKIPKYSITYKKLGDLSEDEKNKLSKLYEYNSENREYIIKNKINEDKFLNTIINYCKHRYDFNIKLSDLNSLISKKKIRIKVK